MGHCIPAPYGGIFMRLMEAIDNKIITLEQCHKTWVCVCNTWEKKDPESYNA